ncbi:hypothetical protein FNU76_04185 [Chitinimonas arctica]|uniref:Uncharacterized protein n=1 Tax=Chitinimonas arctica TaxID=2594795 RepID=A0A516SBT7_9NEIS|nr:hypothetical protein [Chitinimonas arctica]QDQ25615.1 hypothetical protein FNU76_04185 [Chitinimonas arctica]
MKKSICYSISLACVLAFQSAAWAAPTSSPAPLRILKTGEVVKIDSAQFNYYKAGRCPDATIATPCAMMNIRTSSSTGEQTNEKWGYISYDTEDVSIFLQNYLMYMKVPKGNQLPEGVYLANPMSGGNLSQSMLDSRNQPDLTINCLAEGQPRTFAGDFYLARIPLCVNGIVATRVDKDNKYSNKIIYQPEAGHGEKGGVFYVDTYATQRSAFKAPLSVTLQSEDAAMISRARPVADILQFWPIKITHSGIGWSVWKENSILTFSKISTTPVAEFLWNGGAYKRNEQLANVYYDLSAYITPDGTRLNPDGSKKYD